MAASTQKWETVGKSSKKNKANGTVTSKQQKKALRDNMPTISVADPVKESPTIYEAFIEREEKVKKPAVKEQNKPTSNGDATKKSSHSRKKQAGDRTKDIPISLDEALKRIDVNDLETVLTKDQATFPDNPSVWLKDLASMLNVRLENLSDPDPVFEGKPRDYPMCSLPKPTQSLLRKTLGGCSIYVLEMFLEHCIQGMINDMAKGLSTYGYRIFIQLLALDKPDLVLSSLDKYLEMVRQNQNRSLRCLSIMWAVGQAGNHSLGNGLRVWLELMLPVMSVRALSKYAVDYLVGLFAANSGSSKYAYGVLNFRNFFPILDLVFITHSNLPTALQKKLLGVFPRLKAISLGKSPENNMRNFFPMFLARLKPSCSVVLREELLSSLFECLITDKQCFSVWREMYTKNLDQSGVLLRALVNRYDKIEKRVEKKLLQETIRAFSITNEELSTQGKSFGDGYRVCVTTCKELTLRMSSMGFPWRLLIFLIISVFSGVIIYDGYVSKGFQNSRTARLLQDAGLLTFLEQVWHRIRVYSALALVWLRENIPYYYAKAVEFVEPYLQLFMEKLRDATAYLLEVSKPQRAWLAEKIPQGVAWVQAKVPGVTEVVTQYALLVWEHVLYASLWLWAHIVHILHVTGTWLQENVFTGKMSGENLQKALTSAMTSAQAYSSAAIQWATQLITTKTD